MACFLKLPTEKEKGVLTFTTVENFYQISKQPKLREALFDIKKSWVLGLHHNSPHKNHEFVPDPLFDFHIAGKGDLLSPDGQKFYQLEMDCSNFCPDFFKSDASDKKFWDTLIVARNVGFKSLDDTLTIVRKIFDIKPIRILAIVSHENLHHKSTGPSEFIEEYLKMFSMDERKFFTVMTPSIDYPFPFDLETLAFFYRSSRTFLHTAKNERHPRVVAYAWASGLPVISPEQTASILPDNLKRPPGYWLYKNADEAANSVLQAVTDPFTQEEKEIYSSEFLAKDNLPKFKQEIKRVFDHLKLPFSDPSWILGDLDIRLARHHDGTISRNTIPMNLNDLAGMLRQEVPFPPAEIKNFEMNYLKNNSKPRAVYTGKKMGFFDRLSKSSKINRIKKYLLKNIAKFKIILSPERKILNKQIDRNVEHWNLDNAIIHVHRMLEKINLFEKNKSIKILSVGTCNMLEIHAFKGYGFKDITAIDLVPRKQDGEVIKAMDMHNMTFKDSSFDLIFCSGAFHCTHNPKKLVDQFIRVVKNGGMLAITVPFSLGPSEIYRYDVGSLEKLHDLFSPHIKEKLWSETVPAMSEFNPHHNPLIRTLITIKK